MGGISNGIGLRKWRDRLFDFPLSPSPTFMGRLHTPHTPRFDFRRTPPLREAEGGGPYTAVKHA